MNRVAWMGLAIGAVLALAGRGAAHYLGTMILAIISLLACAGWGIAAVRPFSASGPSAKAFLRAGATSPTPTA